MQLWLPSRGRLVAMHLICFPEQVSFVNFLWVFTLKNVFSFNQFKLWMKCNFGFRLVCGDAPPPPPGTSFFPCLANGQIKFDQPRIIQHSVFFMFYPNFCGHFLTFNSTFLIYPFNFWLLFGAQTSFFANTEIKIVIEQFRTSFLTANDFDRLKITQTHKK